MIRFFSTNGMTELPKWNEDFRVGPWVGKCVWCFFGVAVMFKGK